MTSLFEQITAGTVYTGSWHRAHGGVHSVTEAATGAVIGEIGVADADDVTAAGRGAVAAQPRWEETAFVQRAAVLHRAADHLDALTREERVVMQREEGATAAKVDGEIHKCVEELRAAAALVDQPCGELLPSVDPIELSMARRVPAGVIGVIAPWNAPMLLAMRSVAPALALGNSVLLKPDVKTGISGGIVIARAFEAAGLPAGVLHVLPGGPATGQAVVSCSDIDVISFTGSTEAGRRVGALAGGLLKKVVLELGGNNALIVLDDADLDHAVEAAIAGSLLHQGQICMATGRHLVHESIADEYTERLRAHVAGLRVGDPTAADTHIGPLINEEQARRLGDIVDRAVSEGARMLVGGRQDGPFFTPTLLDDVAPGNAAF
ncbi:aldehyde dehydrogenase family protein, partial [Microbacterium sp.]|uniref:aldehyde dehydrogenase family protein n=1 Tax=Microbacterium sp. TaxID=51671 RepID=UPI003A8C5B47